MVEVRFGPFSFSIFDQERRRVEASRVASVPVRDCVLTSSFTTSHLSFSIPFSLPSSFSLCSRIQLSQKSQAAPIQATTFGGLIYWGGSTLFGLGGTGLLLSIIQWARSQVEQQGNIDGLYTLFYYEARSSLLARELIRSILQSLNLTRLQENYTLDATQAWPMRELMRLADDFHNPEAITILENLVEGARAHIEQGEVDYYYPLEDARRFPDSRIQNRAGAALSQLDASSLAAFVSSEPRALNVLLNLYFEHHNRSAGEGLRQIDLPAFARSVSASENPNLIRRTSEMFMRAGLAGNTRWAAALQELGSRELAAPPESANSYFAWRALVTALPSDELRELDLSVCENLIEELRAHPEWAWRVLYWVEEHGNRSGDSVLASLDPSQYAGAREGSDSHYEALILREMVQNGQSGALDVLINRVEEGARVEDLRALRQSLETARRESLPAHLFSFSLENVRARLGQDPLYDAETERCFHVLAGFWHEEAQVWVAAQSPEDRMGRRYFYRASIREEVERHLTHLEWDSTTREDYALQITIDWMRLSENVQVTYYADEAERALGQVPLRFVSEHRRMFGMQTFEVARPSLLAWASQTYMPLFDAYALADRDREELLNQLLFREEGGRPHFVLVHPSDMEIAIQERVLRNLGTARLPTVAHGRASEIEAARPAPGPSLRDLMEGLEHHLDPADSERRAFDLFRIDPAGPHR